MESKKNLYNNILNISKKISELIQLENFDEIDEYLNKRTVFLDQISKRDFEIDEIKELIKKIKALDEKNLAQMSQFKQAMSKNILIKSKNINAISFYKQEEIYKARLIDERSE